MAGGEKLITQELERLEREMVPEKYCLRGKLIRSIKGAASEEFSQHVTNCGQCSQALEGERAEPRQ